MYPEDCIYIYAPILHFFDALSVARWSRGSKSRSASPATPDSNEKAISAVWCTTSMRQFLWFIFYKFRSFAFFFAQSCHAQVQQNNANKYWTNDSLFMHSANGTWECNETCKWTTTTTILNWIIIYVRLWLRLSMQPFALLSFRVSRREPR